MPQFNTPQSICRFGLARCDITPPVGTYHRMWGAAAHDRSVGVHRPLTATAMIFEPADAANDERQVVVAMDHCLLFDREMQQLLDRVCEATSLPREQLLVTFSHTHAAGLMDIGRAPLPGGDLIAPYLEELAAKTASIIKQAIDSTGEVTIVHATGRCSLAADRDFWDEANKLFVCGFNPERVADDTLLVARVMADNGQVVATIVNYACHPTTLAWANQLISPDFPGAMREVVEQATGAPCVFLQGASGDLGPRDGFVGDVEVADRNGRQLGYAALAALESAPAPRTTMRYQGPVISGATIGAWKHEPLADAELDHIAHWQRRCWTFDLPYRKGLPKIDEIRSQLAHWQHEEQAARDADDSAKAADARAMVERMNRWTTRLSALPQADHFPFPITMWRIGGALWLAVEGEPYNVLQRALRERFPDLAIIVMVLANGSRAWYMPTAETYGTGIYQESMANLEAGSLETLFDAIGREIERWQAAVV
jgi:hypothetical protein